MTRLALVLLLATAAPALADKTADASYKEGLAYKQEGKIDDAIKAMEEATATNPKHLMAWSSLGAMYKQKKDYPKSIEAYEHATQLLPANPSDKKSAAVLWSNLGGAYANSSVQKYDQALVALQTACKLDPTDANTRALLGSVQRKKGDNAGAITNLEIAVKAQPSNADWQHNLGVAYRFAKRDDDAIKAFNAAIAINGNDPVYHFDLAVVYRRKQDPDHAIPEYEKATSLDPANADGWFDLGFMYKENHENDKAIDAMKHYLDLKKGKDPEGEKRVTDECQAMGGCKDDSKKKPTPKKK
ncbi:MAG: tetratricopeptide repeat protein [Kofleriaceae bacterium]